jgi:hypothetical protein
MALRIILLVWFMGGISSAQLNISRPAFVAGVLKPASGGGGYTQIQTQGNDTDNNGLSTSGVNRILYSSFVTATGDAITKIRVRLLKVGSPTFNIQCKLYTDSGGSGPTSTQLGVTSTETLGSATLTTSYADYEFTFSPGLSVANGTKYWVAMVASADGDGSNFVRWSGNPAGTGQQWRTGIDFSNSAEVQASMDGSLTTFKTP